MAGSFERMAGAKEENTIFGPITRFHDSPFRHLIVKDQAPQYLKTISEILNSDEIINPTPNQVAGFIGGVNSHKTDPNCEKGQHSMKNGELLMPTLERVTNAGIASAATDEDEETGVHLKRNGVGAGVVKTMSMSDRGIASADTIDGEETGVHLRVQGERAGIDLTPSMSARGSASLGSQRIDRPIMLLEFQSSTVEPDAPPVSKYTRNQNGIADVLMENQFFKAINRNTRARIKEWKDAASNSDDNSHPFTTKPRSDNAPRATDVWKLSLHESVESVLTIAPNATEVTTDDRAVSASYREGDAQQKAAKRKRKHE